MFVIYCHLQVFNLKLIKKSFYTFLIKQLFEKLQSLSFSSYNRHIPYIHPFSLFAFILCRNVEYTIILRIYQTKTMQLIIYVPIQYMHNSVQYKLIIFLIISLIVR